MHEKLIKKEYKEDGRLGRENGNSDDDDDENGAMSGYQEGDEDRGKWKLIIN
jgi:hypothetical protein